MTRNAVAQISTNNTTTLERKKMYCPITASEAYNLGMEMEKMLSGIYCELENKCNNSSAKKVLKSFLKQNQQDMASFYDGFGFSLNCEIGNFYRSKGAVISYEDIEKQMTATKPLITRNLENFFRKTEAIQNDLNHKENSDLGEYFNTKSSSDVYEVCMQVRANSSELYERLAKLYPEGEIRKAFEEMAQVIVAGSSKIDSKM